MRIQKWDRDIRKVSYDVLVGGDICKSSEEVNVTPFCFASITKH